MASERTATRAEIDDVLDRLEVWHGPGGRPVPSPAPASRPAEELTDHR